MRRRLSPAYFAEPLLNPVPFLLAFALLAGAAGRGLPAAAALAGVGLKLGLDALLARRLLGRTPSLLNTFLGTPLKDVLILGIWATALFKSTVCWRGHRLRVGPGSVLSPVAEPAIPAMPARAGALREVA